MQNSTENRITNRIKFMNISIDNVTMKEALKEIDRLIRLQKNSYVVTPNVDHIVKLEKDKELQEVYDNADLILTDGQPLVWISKLYRTPIKEKVPGSDLFPLLCDLSARRGYRMYFLGAAEGVAEKAAENLKQKFTGLKVCGTYSPTKSFESKPREIEYIIEDVRSARPDILIVGLGCPKQEKFIYKYKDQLKVPISLGLGASLDFEAGHVKRAPKWMRDRGLEWFWRITQDPGRLAKRYLIDDIKIIGLGYKYRPYSTMSPVVNARKKM